MFKSESHQLGRFTSSTSRASAAGAAGAALRLQKQPPFVGISNTGIPSARLNATLSRTQGLPGIMSSSGTKGSAATVARIGPSVFAWSLNFVTATPESRASSLRARICGHHHRGPMVPFGYQSIASRGTTIIIHLSSYAPFPYGMWTTRYRCGRSAICRTWNAWNTSNWRTWSRAAIDATRSRPRKKRRNVPTTSAWARSRT